jgi:ubiquinone/menaquinone biosynthesis C-methylase UbiE
VFLFNYASVVDPILKDLRICVTKLLEIQADDRVLDVCCGTGNQVFYYEQEGAIATGVDDNSKMLKISEKNKNKQRLKNVTFHLASATKLPFPDDYFDCASISLGLHEMKRDHREKAVSEMKRVVKRGGALIFADFKVPLLQNRIGYLIRVVEFIAGKDNYKCFKDYLSQGGLDQILKENQLQPQTETLLKLGTLQIIRSNSL